MKPINAQQCDVHILICTNDREDGRSACLKLGGMDFFRKFKTKVREAGLLGTHWVTRTGCLGFCNPVGTTVAVHRKGKAPVWYHEVTGEDFDLLWDKIMRE